MRVKAIVERIIKQFLRDKRSLALLIAAPILVLSLIWLVLGGDEYDPVIAYKGIPAPLEEALQTELTESLLEMTETEAMKALEEEEIDAYVTLEEGNLNILLEGSYSTVNRAVQKSIQEAFQTLGTDSAFHITFDYLYGSEQLRLFDQIGPVLIGLLIFFFVFIIGGISFLRERTRGTLEKLLSTPVKRWEIVTGYVLGFGIFTVIQSAIIVAYSVYLLDMWMAGEFWHLLIVSFLLAMTALTLAILLSAFAKNEFQMMQFIPLVIIPQVFFSGLFHIETLHPWLQTLSKFMPLTYGANAMRDIMIKGSSIWDTWPDMTVIIGFMLLFITLNIIALKKYRTL